MLARADLESLLRARKLDLTLTSGLRPGQREPAPTGVSLLDAHLGGGLPRGELSEIAGPRSSGRTSLLQACLVAATARGELVAIVDTFDSFDPASGAAAGIDLTYLLWIRGHHPAGGGSGGGRPVARFVDRAVKALGIVLHAGGFGLVVLDLADVPMQAIRQLPFTTWLRIGRAIEGSRTTCVLVAPEPLARSAGGVTLALQPAMPAGRWAGASDHMKVFRGFDFRARIVSARRRPGSEKEILLKADHDVTEAQRHREIVSWTKKVSLCLRDSVAT